MGNRVGTEKWGRSPIYLFLQQHHVT
jgi:hypothetical protein